MKTINVNNREFQYELFYSSSEYGINEWTEFYEGYLNETYRKYLLFGPILIRKIPIKVFQLDLCIEDESYTKAEIRRMIEKKIELLNRKQEIKRGEII